MEKEKLKKLFIKEGIQYCELKFEGCWNNNALGFAHRHKRAFYYDRPNLLGSISHVILACNHCHSIIEKDARLTEELFQKLRGNELKKDEKIDILLYDVFTSIY